MILALLLAATTQAATLRGAVKGQGPARRAAPAEDSEYSSSDHAKLFDYSHLRDAVVYAQRLDGKGKVEATGYPLTLTRRGDEPVFTPAFLAVPAGASLDLKNDTGASATVYAAGGSPGALTARVEGKTTLGAKLAAPGLYRLYALEDARPEALVLSAGSYVALVDDTGAYQLTLPPGKYRVTAWHQRLPPSAQEVTVDKDDVHLDFTLSAAQIPQVP